MSEQTRIEEIQILCQELAGINSKIRVEANTRKKKGTEPYAILTGYATAVRRPVRDLLKWMDLVEETMILIVVELEEQGK